MENAMAEDTQPISAATRQPALARRLTLPLAVLFGLGVTIGAGIYVLIGTAAARGGMHAPLAFLLAALVMAPTAASFAELTSRLPVSAGEAAYVRAGFRSDGLSLVVGLCVILIAVLAAAAISRGSTGYIRELTGLPVAVILPLVVLATGATAAWGIRESVTVAATFTLIEIAGLVAIVAVGVVKTPGIFERLPEIWTGLGNTAALAGVLAATLLAFFAFIGFEGLANIAEEVVEPEKTLPRAILWTLVLTSILYIAVVWVALTAVSRDELAGSDAPLSLVFERVTGASPALISAIAVFATVNGIIAQMIMASRVVYGLANQRQLPHALATVNATTRTPLVATGLIVAVVMLLAAAFPIDSLAEATSLVTLAVFAMVNAALGLIRWRREPAPAGAIRMPIWVPWLGCTLCLALFAASVAG